MKISNAEIDWETSRSTAPQTSRITCRVCDRPATVPLNHPALLCLECLSDLSATSARVQAWIDAAVKQLDDAKANWEVKLKWSPSQPRWAAVATALAQVADGELDRSVLESRWRITKQQGGAMAELLTAYEVYTAETDRIGAELKRLELARAEIEAAR